MYVFYSLTTSRNETFYRKITCEVIQAVIEIRKLTELISFHDIDSKIFIFVAQVKVKNTVGRKSRQEILSIFCFVVDDIPWLNHVS